MWSRLLEEEATKRAELEQIHLRQQRAISETEAEKQELEKERLAKESALQAAMQQLEHLEKERQGALEQYQVSRTTLSPRLHRVAALCGCWTGLSQTLRVVSVVLWGTDCGQEAGGRHQQHEDLEAQGG